MTRSVALASIADAETDTEGENACEATNRTLPFFD